MSKKSNDPTALPRERNSVPMQTGSWEYPTADFKGIPEEKKP
jgi:hypothetical protein